MATLPTPGGDVGTWGTELNDFLSVAHGAGGLIDVGSGDAVTFYNATTAQQASLAIGTSGSPDTTTHPLLKVERTINIASAAVTGDGVENCSALIGIAAGTSACETQPVGVAGFAKTASTSSPPGNDACGIYGGGNVTGSGNGVGIGGFFVGRNDSTAGQVCAVEATSYNGTGSDDSYTSAGFSDSQAMWITSSGPNRSSAAIVIGKPAGRTTFDVGLAATAENPITTAFIRDDSTSPTSVLVNGTHATAGIAIAAGAGPLCVGATSIASGSQCVMEVIHADATADPGVVFGRTSGTARDFSIQWRSGGATNIGSKFFFSATAGAFLTSTAAGDTGIKVGATGKTFHLGGSTKIVSVTADNTLGFFAATPVAKPTVSGAKGSNAALGSLMTALANLGLVTDSTSA